MTSKALRNMEVYDWIVTLCALETAHHFRGTHRLQPHRGAELSFCWILA
jgi:hypothetical protein